MKPLDRAVRLPLLALALLLARAAGAQENPTLRGFDPDPFRPAATLDGDFVVESAAPTPAGSARGALLFDYARGLLALRQGDQKVGDLLVDRVQAHVIAGYSFGRLQVGLDLPVALHQTSRLSLLSDAGITGALVDPVAAVALGDLRGVARYSVLDEATSGIASLAVALEARAPTGNRQAFYGDGPMVVPSVFATRHLGAWRLDLDLGYTFRGPGQYLQLVVHDGWNLGLSASTPLPRLGPIPDWRAILEVNAQLPRGIDFATARYRAPLEARAGVRARIWQALSVELGAGAGLTTEPGYGREAFRVFGGLRWDFTPGDRDGDGIPDGQDSCPDVSGPPGQKGCPDGDADGDGVPDSEDHCPNAAGAPENGGCPDTDGDGIPDNEDKCPKEPGPAQQDGCPVTNPPFVTLQETRLELRVGITFDTGKDTIRAESYPVLNEVAQVLIAHPEQKHIRVEGHTDNAGSAALNKRLSQRRAQSVVRYLAQHGVARERLSARGYGPERPIASNGTPLGRAKNRRVEFTLLHEKEEADEPLTPLVPTGGR